MRIVSFNVHHGTVGAGEVVDSRRLGEVCAGFDADVLALQEIERGVTRSGRVDLPATVAEATGMELVFGPVARIGGGQYGNALLVRGSIAEVSTHRLYRPALRWRRERRGSIEVFAHLDRPGCDLSVTATHLSVKKDEVDRQLAAIIARVADGVGPRVLLGDFNRRPNHVEAAARGTGLTVADTTPPTFPSDRPRIRIDHLLVAGVNILEVSVPEVPMSDHRPLVVDVAVPIPEAKGATTATPSRPSR